jgi:hypothetical protein
MINEPISLTFDGFQEAWLNVVRLLVQSQWEVRNLVVQIRKPALLDQHLHERIAAFAESEELLGPKHVAYTIFPHKLYEVKGTATDLFTAYNRPGGLYERLHHRKHGWGTYFRRMTNYDGAHGKINQLETIIAAIRTRDNISRAAYTVVIQNPGGETVRPLGGPCLNYIAVQLESGQPMVLGVLAVYRNHDFLEKAYGNYWGLCNLLAFITREVGALPGPLTCVSSRAYVSGRKTAVKALVEGL